MRAIHVQTRQYTIHEDRRIQGSLFGSDIKMYTGISPGNVPFPREKYITNTGLVTNNDDNYDLSCHHVVYGTRVGYLPRHLHLHTSSHINKRTQFYTASSPESAHPAYNPSTLIDRKGHNELIHRPYKQRERESGG